MAVRYEKGLDWNSEEEVDAIKGLRPRVDDGLSVAVNRASSGTAPRSGTDPVAAIHLGTKAKMWISEFAQRSDGKAARVASFKNRAKSTDDRVLYATPVADMPDFVVIATADARIDWRE